MAEPRPGAALAAALQQTAQQLAQEQTMASKVVASPGASHASHASFSAQLRRLEQQIELERRQVERRLDKMERRIEEVASLSTSSGRWAELQGHVDGLEESLQNLIKGTIELAPARSHGANRCNGQVHGGSPASWGRVSELDDQVLQISHRLLRLEHSLQGYSGDIERQPQEMLKFKDEVQEVLGHMESFKGWEEQMVMLEDQVGGMGRRLEDVTHELQEILETREAEDLVENLEERRWRLAMSAKQVTSGVAEGELRQELSTISEDLTSLFMRVEQSEVGLYSLADAVSRVCEELSHLRTGPLSQRSTAVTQPVPGFAGASVVADAPC